MDNTQRNANTLADWRLAEIPVQPFLSPYIGTFYYLHLPRASEQSPLHRVIAMATPSLDLVINLGDPFTVETFGDAVRVDSPVFLSGPRPTTTFLRRDGVLTLLGVRFKHGAIASLLPYPAKELEQRFVGLDQLWQETATALAAAAQRSATTADLVYKTEEVLGQLFANAKRPDPMVRQAVKLIAQHQGDLEVSALAEALGVSRQTVKHKFDQHVGLSPKLFGKLRRFQAVLRRLAGTSKVDWTHLAQESGYYDQAHLIREFNHFTGFSPQKFLKNLEKGDDLYLFDSADQTHYHLERRIR